MKTLQKVLFVLVSVLLLTTCSKDSSPEPQNNNTGQSTDNPPANNNTEVPIGTIIGAQGGEVQSDDGIVKFVFPEGALNSEVDVVIEVVSESLPIEDQDIKPIGSTYKLSPSGLNFTSPIKVIIDYTKIQGEFDIETLSVIHWTSPNVFEYIPIHVYSNTQISYELNSFSNVSLIDIRNKIYKIVDENGTFAWQVFNFRWDIPEIKWFIDLQDSNNTYLTEENVNYALDLWSSKTSSFIFKKAENIGEANIIFKEVYDEESIQERKNECNDLIQVLAYHLLNGFLCPPEAVQQGFANLTSSDKVTIFFAKNNLNNLNFTEDTQRAREKYTIAHELGHAIGLGHTRDEDCELGDEMPIMMGACGAGNLSDPILQELDLLSLYEHYEAAENNQDLDALIAYYPFNGNANDESGNGNDGTVNGALLTTDRFGNFNSAYSFDDTGNKRISLGTGINPTNMENLTVSAWIKLEAESVSCCDGDSQTILGQGSGTGSSSQYPFWFLFTYNGRYAIKRNAPSLETDSNFYPEDSNWHFVTATVEGVSAKLYFDGVEVKSTTYTNPAGGTNYPLSIGNLGDAQGTFGNTFNGVIDEVRIYNRALSPSEVYDLMGEIIVSDDDDNDGVTNSDDLCPNTPIGEPIDVYGCADSQKDTDGDGVYDNVDQCPNTPEGETVNENGCSQCQIDNTAPVVTDATVTDITTNSFTVDWSLDEESRSYILYGTTSSSLDGSTINDNNYNTSYIQKVGENNPLNPGTVYYWRIYTEDQCGNSNLSAISLIRTLDQTDIELVTGQITNIDYSSATINGELLSDGDGQIDSFGYCIATSVNPTINDTTIQLSPQIGPVTSEFQGLNEKTTYHVRMFAQTNDNIIYGENVQFRTIEFLDPPLVLQYDDGSFETEFQVLAAFPGSVAGMIFNIPSEYGSKYKVTEIHSNFTTYNPSGISYNINLYDNVSNPPVQLAPNAIFYDVGWDIQQVDRILSYPTFIIGLEVDDNFNLSLGIDTDFVSEQVRAVIYSPLTNEWNFFNDSYIGIRIKIEDVQDEQ